MNISRIIDHLQNGTLQPKEEFRRFIARIYLRKRDDLFLKHFVNGPKSNAVLLASYPKSGNTFFRFVWFNIITLMEGQGREVDFISLDRNMPYIGFFSDIKQIWRYETLPCLLKTHELYQKAYASFSKIHVFRNPFDTMISNYNYSINRKGGPSGLSLLERAVFNNPGLSFHGSFSAFVSREIGGYCKHFISWCKLKDVFPISYEAMLFSKDTCFLYINRILSELGFSVPDEVLSKAIELSQSGRLKDKPPSKRMSNLGQMRFIRDGRISQHQGCMTDKEYELIERALLANGLKDPATFPQPYRELMNHFPWRPLQASGLATSQRE